MRTIIGALCFAVAFALPACLAAVAYPFDRAPAASLPIDAMSFQAFCLYALGAGTAGGIIYAVVLACRRHDSSMAKSALAGVFTLLLAVVVPVLLALVVGTEPRWLGRSVLPVILVACPILAALLFGKPRSNPATASVGPSSRK